MQDCDGREIKIGHRVEHIAPVDPVTNNLLSMPFRGIKTVRDFASSTCVVTWPPDRAPIFNNGKETGEYIGIPNVYIADFLRIVE